MHPSLGLRRHARITRRATQRTANLLASLVRGGYGLERAPLAEADTCIPKSGDLVDYNLADFSDQHLEINAFAGIERLR